MQGWWNVNMEFRRVLLELFLLILTRVISSTLSLWLNSRRNIILLKTVTFVCCPHQIWISHSFKHCLCAGESMQLSTTCTITVKTVELSWVEIPGSSSGRACPTCILRQGPHWVRFQPACLCYMSSALFLPPFLTLSLSNKPEKLILTTIFMQNALFKVTFTKLASYLPMYCCFLLIYYRPALCI